MPPVDVDSIEQGVDLDKVDFAAMDRGDKIDAPAVVVEAPDDKKDDVFVPAVVVEEEVEAKVEPARDEKGKFTDARIPKARFDEAVGKEREAREAAERRAQDAERRLQEQANTQQRTSDLSEMDTVLASLEKTLDGHILDGDVDKAQTVRADIRQLNRQIQRAESQQEATVIVGRELEQQRLNVTITRLEADHPVLNKASEQFDPDIVQMIVLAQQDMVREGMLPSLALSEAATYVVNKLEKLRGPARVASATPSLDDAQSKVDDRTKSAVQKALDTQIRQPASLKEGGLDSDKLGTKGLPDVSGMSSEEFAALPEATRARMRGDLV